MLHPGDYVICTDEKPSIQARKRIAPTRPARPGEPMKVEHEYERKGALCYLAAWDTRRAKIFDRARPKTALCRLTRSLTSSCPKRPTSTRNAYS